MLPLVFPCNVFGFVTRESSTMCPMLLPLTAHRIPSPLVILRPAHPLPLPLLSIPIKSAPFLQSSASRVSIPRASNALHSNNDESEVARVADRSGLEEENGNQTAKGFSSKELMQGLKRYGVAGVLSYGLFNTIYYLTTFLLVWFFFAPAPGKLGYTAAVERFLKVMAMVWAGSQVTKIVRAGGALALAPFVDKGLSWFTVKFKFESKGKAFAAIASFCFGLTLLLFFGLTLLWA